MRTIRIAHESSKLRQAFHTLLILLLLCRVAEAVEIGQTRQEIIARHGPAPLGDTPRGIAIYRWDVWRLEIQFVDETARKLIYTKTDPIADSDIASILYENGGNESWRQINSRLWFRTDGAMAALDATNNRTLVLQGIRRFIRPMPTPIPSVPPMPRQAPFDRPSVDTGPSPTAFADIAPVQMLVPMPLKLPERVTSSATRAKTPTPPFKIPWFPSLALLIAVTAGVRLYSLLGPLVSPRTRGSSWQPTTDAATSSGVQIPCKLHPPLKSAPSINSVTWDQFELVIAEVFRRHRYMVELASGLGSDGGVDVKLFRDGITTLVQCKQWKTWKVSVKSIREFYGVLVSEGAQRGFFISTGQYTKDCLEFAAGKPIDLLSRQDIDQLLKPVERPGENLWDLSSWIDQFISGAQILDPSCPYCRRPMVLRHPKNGVPFWGCSTYPKCRGKRKARLELLKGNA